MGIKKDIVGQRFGNMTVLEDSGLRNNKKVIWTCECDCGEIFNTRSDRIYSGSCTCCPTCANEKKMVDLTGQRFGKLIVLNRYYELNKEKRTTRRTVLWNCQCDYGNTTIADGAHLRDGNIKSCGCLKDEHYKDLIIDLTGLRVGMLTVLNRTNKKASNGTYLWTCQCDCGNVKDIDGYRLRTQDVMSCGCQSRSNGEYKIYLILIENNIKFEEQKTFDTCRFPNTNMPGRYDFYLPDYNLLIEYDGIQHFSYQENINSWNTKENFEQVQYRDAYKNQWAEENNIKLKRIPYYDYDKITLKYLLN